VDLGQEVTAHVLPHDQSVSHDLATGEQVPPTLGTACACWQHASVCPPPVTNVLFLDMGHFFFEKSAPTLAMLQFVLAARPTPPTAPSHVVSPASLGLCAVPPVMTATQAALVPRVELTDNGRASKAPAS
jgi:hypothetical protein